MVEMVDIELTKVYSGCGGTCRLTVSEYTYRRLIKGQFEGYANRELVIELLLHNGLIYEGVTDKVRFVRIKKYRSDADPGKQD